MSNFLLGFITSLFFNLILGNLVIKLVLNKNNNSRKSENIKAVHQQKERQ